MWPTTPFSPASTQMSRSFYRIRRLPSWLVQRLLFFFPISLAIGLGFSQIRQRTTPPPPSTPLSSRRTSFFPSGAGRHPLPPLLYLEEVYLFFTLLTPATEEEEVGSIDLFPVIPAVLHSFVALFGPSLFSRGVIGFLSHLTRCVIRQRVDLEAALPTRLSLSLLMQCGSKAHF